MKLRHGFVSNSSSASFVIPAGQLSIRDVQKLKTWLTSDANEIDDWSMHEQPDGSWSFFTVIDNGGLDEWLAEELPIVLEVREQMERD